MSYVNLHAHYDTSLLDGMGKVEDYIRKAKTLGHKSLGISDHGNMINTLNFYKQCKKNDIKPIIGCEFYYADGDKNYHLCLYAMNSNGLKNLYRLTYEANMKNFYYKPRINREMLLKYNKDLICTTACIAGELGQAILNKENVFEISSKLKFVFGDRLFYEIQPNSLPAQKIINEAILTLFPIGQITLGLDCHYVDKEDYETHDTLLAMSTKKKKDDSDRMRFTTNEFYYMEEKEIYEKLSYIDEEKISEVLNNTMVIADMCNVEIDFSSNFLPKLENEKELILKAVNDGIKRRYSLKDITMEEVPAIKERAKYELKNIINKGYASYFLIVQDYINYCKSVNIPVGVGRGSVGGSEVAFLMGIQEVEPIRHGLLYERFLNPERDTHPDVDTDVCYLRRGEVITYIKNKYGAENVCQIIAKAKFAFQKTINDVLRVYDFPPQTIRQTSKKIGDTNSFDLLEENFPDVISNWNKIDKRIYTDMKKIYDNMSHVSKHAAGIVISPVKVHDILPLQRDTEDETMTISQFDKKEVEEVGAYKYDLLGLKLLTIFDKTLKNIKKNKGIDINLHDLFHINLEDEGIYEVLKSGNLLGVFQFEAPSAEMVVNRVKPTCFEDIVACESICRPGVKEADFYITNAELYKKEGAFPVPTYWDKVKHILEATYGALVYQEQTMMLFHDIGGYTLGEADKLRKAKSLEPERDRFTKSALSKGFTLEEANNLFDRFDLGYSFNKSHAVAYGINSACCAWLIKYYPTEFFSAYSTLELTKTEPNIQGIIKYAKTLGIEFHRVDINKSTYDFECEGNKILMPLCCINNVGDKACSHIIDMKPYNSFEDFCNKIEPRKCNKKVVKNLIMAGAFDSFNKNRSDVMKKYNDFFKTDERISFWCDEVCIQYEFQTYGFAMTKHPLDGYINENFNEKENGTSFYINVIIKEAVIRKDKNGKDMAFLTLENKECIFKGLVFSYLVKQCNKLLIQGNKVTVNGKKDGSSFLINSITTL